MSNQGPRDHGGQGQYQNQEGQYQSVPYSFSPLWGGAKLPARACPKGGKRWERAQPLPAAPACVGGEEAGRGTQVARLSAGRLDMRSWELLLLRMESWVPPFTPLLARDGCRCLKSMVK